LIFSTLHIPINSNLSTPYHFLYIKVDFKIDYTYLVHSIQPKKVNEDNAKDKIKQQIKTNKTHERKTTFLLHQF
jgi:hypothetical protein